MSHTSPDDYAFDTRLVHAGEAPDPATGAHGVPLYQNSTFAFRSYDQVMGFEEGVVPHYVYQRYGTPTVRCLELKMANLESAETSVAAATGMAAISASLMQLLGNGCHLVAGDDLYSVTGELLADDLPASGVGITRVPIRDLDAVSAAMTSQTRMIYAETLSNPGIQLADVRGLAAIAHGHGALLVVDNTFLSPALARPLEEGADLVIHSATKYLAGTGQMMGGFVSGSQALIRPIASRIARHGSTMPPFAAWQILQGIKTLGLRMERHSSTAAAIADLLSTSGVVEVVNYPGDRGHHYGGVLSFRLTGGRDAARAFFDALDIVTIAVSLGEPTSLIWPFRDGTIRFSVGLENPDDLLMEFARALAAASRGDSA